MERGRKMIIGKEDKKRVEKLEEKYYEQSKEIRKLKFELEHPKEDDNKEHIEFLLAQIKDYGEREKELLTIIKAIINKFGAKEIVITHKEIEEAKELQLYVEDEYLRYARKYKVINPIQLLHSFKEENKWHII